MNGDGFDDLIIGAPAADGNFDSSGVSYVVYGKADSGAVDLSAIAEGVGGFVINGPTGKDGFGTFVSAAGDVNGYGFDDLIVGAPHADSVTMLNTDGPEPVDDDPFTENPDPSGPPEREQVPNSGGASKVDSGVSYVIFGGPDVLIFNKDTNDNSAPTGQGYDVETVNPANSHEFAALEAPRKSFERFFLEGENPPLESDFGLSGGQIWIADDHVF
jgi:hypothetical protein